MPMVDIDWLKEHVEVPSDLTYEQLAKDLVRVGLEEEEIHASQVTGPIVVDMSSTRRRNRRRTARPSTGVMSTSGPAYNAARRERQEGAARHHLRRPEHGRRREGRRDLAGRSAARRFQDRTAQDLRPRFRRHVRLGARARTGRQPRRHHPAARLRLHASGIQGAQARRRRDAPAAPRPADPGNQHHPGSRLCVLVPWRGPRIPSFHRREVRRSGDRAQAGVPPAAPRPSPASPATSRSSSTTTTRFTASPAATATSPAPSTGSTRRITRRTGCAGV